MKYFYSAAVMGYGFGRKWHSLFNFPRFHRVTKTLTYSEKKGHPFAVLPLGKSVWNRVSLHNIGLPTWYYENMDKSLLFLTVSIAGESYQLKKMIYVLNNLQIGGIEINYSCPNYKSLKYEYDIIKYSKHPVYLKLRWDDDPFKYDLDNVKGIRLNSVPAYGGGMSGKYAQFFNWTAIKRWCKDGLPVAGCSFTTYDDIVRLEDMGVKEVGIGSTILTNPRLIESLSNDKFTSE